MNIPPTYLQTFNQTTVNRDQVHAYLLGFPRYYVVGYDTALSEHALKLLNCTDFFELQFRRYLAGLYPTLRRVFREVRMFQQNYPDHADQMIAFSLEAVKKTILLNEWYELMPRCELAITRINRQFNLPTLDINQFV